MEFRSQEFPSKNYFNLNSTDEHPAFKDYMKIQNLRINPEIRDREIGEEETPLILVPNLVVRDIFEEEAENIGWYRCIVKA